MWLAASGMSLAGIGLATGASLPWALKFLWAPLVDRLGSRRMWIRVCLGLLAVTTAVLAGADPIRHAGQLAALLLLYVTLSATQDIAVDAYTIETTHGRELGVANSVRIGAYRSASFVSSALLVWVAARHGWHAAFLAGAGLLGALAFATLVLPSPRRESARPATLAEPIRSLLQRPGIWAVVLFALRDRPRHDADLEAAGADVRLDPAADQGGGGAGHAAARLPRQPPRIDRRPAREL